MASEAEENQEDRQARNLYAKRMRELQMEQQKKELARKYMTPGAYERLMNVRVANYELYSQLVNFILSLAQSGKATSRITEEQLKSILAKLTYKPEPTIEFKHK